MKVGEVVRALRLERQLTLEAVAFKAGVDPAYLSRLERNQRKPTEETLRRLSEALGTSLTELYAKVEAKRHPHTGPAQLREAEAEDYQADAVKLRRLFRELTPANQKLAMEFVRLLRRLQVSP